MGIEGTPSSTTSSDAARERATVLVVPCFDEAKRLPVAAFREGLASDPFLSLLFVDDGSRDATSAVAASVGAGLEGRSRVVTLPKNVGKGEAVRHGMLEALDARPAFVGYWDADLATPLSAVEPMRVLLAARPEVLLVMGTRVQALGRLVRRSAIRHYAGRVMATLIARTLRLDVYDTQCGAKLFRATRATDTLFHAPFTTRWLFDVEILARIVDAHRRGAMGPPEKVVIEQPLERWTDVAGSKVKPMDFFRALRDLGRIRRDHGLGKAGSADQPRESS